MTTEPEGPTIVDVVRVLRETYTDEGVLIYLNAHINGLRGTPAEMIRTGRVAELLEFVERIESDHG